MLTPHFFEENNLNAMLRGQAFFASCANIRKSN